VRFKAEAERVKAEYLVAAGASPDAIRLRFDGDAGIRRSGMLIVRNESGEFQEEKPFLFQEGSEGRVEVSGGFRLLGEGVVGFRVGAYDRARELVIDPSLVFSGYFGGASQTTITGVTVNSYYNTIVAGYTVGSDLPASGGYQPQYKGGVDAFVAGFNPSGGLIFCTYLGGSGDDRAFGIAVDSSNNTYITGWTQSANFPTVNPAQSKIKGTRDAFVAKLNPAGSQLLYSTYLGGTGMDQANAIAIDASGNAVVVGDTTSTNLPVTSGAFQTALKGGQDVFVAKLGPNGNQIVWLTYFGGSTTDHAAAVRFDGSWDVVFAGSTWSTDIPVASAFQASNAGGQDGFGAALNPTGTGLIFSTYIGGSGGSPGAPEQVNAIAFGPGGNVMFAGVTSSTNFPVTSGVLQSTFGGGNTDGFLISLNPTNHGITKSTYLGGSGDDAITALAADSCCWLYAAGSTSSTDFPTQNPVQASNGGALDAFVTKLSFSKVLFSTFLGGSGSDSATSLAIDSLFNIVIAGSTGSSNLPVSGSLGSLLQSSLSSFIAKLSSNYTLGVAATPTFLIDTSHNTGYNGPNVTLTSASYGISGDIPIAGDWSHTGKKQIGVFRNGTWILDTNGNGVLDASDKYVSFGQTGDVPVVGDWTGDGTLKLGLFRQGTFILDLSGHLSGTPTGLSDLSFPFGQSGDIPVVADWNGSGVSKVGVFRSGQWLVDYNGDHVFNALDKTYNYGQAGDVPVVGDWSGTGIANQIGIYRRGLWILNTDGADQIFLSGQYETYLGFGGVNYSPLVF
jgi:hypothetical protein